MAEYMNPDKPTLRKESPLRVGKPGYGGGRSPGGQENFQGPVARTVSDERIEEYKMPSHPAHIEMNSESLDLAKAEEGTNG